MKYTIERTLRHVCLIGSLLAVGACGIQSDTFHGNGQLLVLPGESDSNGDRQGVWVYFNDDGSVKTDDDEIDGIVHTRTGFYEHGVRVRMPTDSELDESMLEAKRMTDSFRKH